MEKFLQLIQSLLVLLLMLFGGETDHTPTPTAVPTDSRIEVHFIDVGQADAALVICDGEAMLIDGGNVEDSSLIYTYLSDRNIDHLRYTVVTHAHEDHVGGVSGALNYAVADTILCPVTSYDSKAFNSLLKTLNKQGGAITVPTAGDSFSLGTATVEILHCNPSAEEPNNTGIVLRIVHGETSFLFTGDAEQEVEEQILDEGREIQCTVLKVGHHGSNTSTSYRWLYEAYPAYAVISVGADNSYGHPHEEVTARLNDADVTVYRTDRHGTILCIGDGQTLTFTTEKQTQSIPD